MDHTIPSHQQCVKFQESSQHIIALLWPSFPSFLTMGSMEFRALPRSPRSEMSLFSQWNIWHRRWSDDGYDGYDVDLMMHMIPRFRGPVPGMHSVTCLLCCLLIKPCVRGGPKKNWIMYSRKNWDSWLGNDMTHDQQKWKMDQQNRSWLVVSTYPSEKWWS